MFYQCCGLFCRASDILMTFLISFPVNNFIFKTFINGRMLYGSPIDDNLDMYHKYNCPSVSNNNLDTFSLSCPSLIQVYCKSLFFRGGLIFAYFAENKNSAKIKHAKIKIGKSHCRSVSAVCIHAYCTTHTKFAQFAIPVCWNPWSTGIL